MFLNEPDVQQSIERLAAADKLTIIAGAGVSAEAGLPTWPTLVESLLQECATVVDSGLTQEEASELVKWIMETDGLPGSGSVIQSILGDEFIKSLRNCLYGDPPPVLKPGPTANEIARLFLEAGRGSEVLTTNYDTLLESALGSRGVPKNRIRRYIVSKRPPSPDDYVVRHLHGVLTPSEQQGKTIVLSDADYYRMQTPGRWQEVHTKGRLEESSCLFVGTSLSDPNLVRYVYRSEPSDENIVIFTRQGDDRATQFLPAVVSARETAARRRWSEGGVLPLYADYYSEVAQFVYEVSLARRALAEGIDYQRFATRLAEWHAAIGEELLGIEDLDDFHRTQDTLQREMTRWLEGVRDFFEEADIQPGPNERLGLHVWVLDPAQYELTLWASSDRAWRDPSTLTPVRIGLDSPWIAVKAFCRGTPLTEETVDDTSSRWNHVLAVPLRLDAEPEDVLSGEDRWGLLPVGAITLASTSEPEESSIGSLAAPQRAELSELLAVVAGNLLRPAEE